MPEDAVAERLPNPPVDDPFARPMPWQVSKARRGIASTLLGIDDPARLELFCLNMRSWRNSLTGATLMTLIIAWVFAQFAPGRPLWIWAGLGGIAYATQALLCLAIERAPDTDGFSEAWSATTVFVSLSVGMLWGSLAWWLPPDAPSLQLLAALGSAMVLLGAATASNSIGTLRAVVLPALVLVPGAMIWHAHMPVAGGVSLMLVVVILRHGISVQRSMVETVQQRHRMEALSSQLRLQQAKLELAEREQAILNERQRLLRDMHDGVGASLISALKMIELGRLNMTEITAVLRECIDDLRLVIDSLEPIDNDLVTLLASLRYRLGDRLERAGIAIEWVTSELPPLPWLRAPQALEVLRLVQEVLANVLKHSQATRVRISMALEGLADAGGSVVLRIDDNGIGFDAGIGTSGRGLKHMLHRATRIGARLSVDSSLGNGTRVRLDFGLDDPATSAAPTAPQE